MDSDLYKCTMVEWIVMEGGEGGGIAILKWNWKIWLNVRVGGWGNVNFEASQGYWWNGIT